MRTRSAAANQALRFASIDGSVGRNRVSAAQASRSAATAALYVVLGKCCWGVIRNYDIPLLLTYQTHSTWPANKGKQGFTRKHWLPIGDGPKDGDVQNLSYFCIAEGAMVLTKLWFGPIQT